MVERKHKQILVKRLWGLTRLAWLVMLVIVGRYWAIQILDGELYRELSDNNRLRKQEIQAPRGVITDRHGVALAENVPSYNLLFDRAASADPEASQAFAARILGVDVATLDEPFAAARMAGFKPVRVADNLSLGQVARFDAVHLERPEFDVAVAHRRLYRFGHQVAHVIGYLGEASRTEVEAGHYKVGDRVGKKGIERRFQDELQGSDGERVVVVDSRGRVLEEYHRAPSSAGRSIALTLDLRLQQTAVRLLDGKVGSIVALDPRDGAVRAMVSAPSFDPNLFAGRLDRRDWNALIEHPDDPLQNRVVQNAYPPGSVFKLVMALAAFDEGMQHTRIYCPGYSRIYNHRFRCWKRGGHGAVDLREALKGSCNVYFHELGRRLEIDRIAELSRFFGLGQATGIDLDGERPGLVPSTAWSEKTRRHPWYPGETISVATGQGPILTTPLQVATMVAAIANGGDRVRPHLRQDDATAERDKLPFDAARLAFIRDAMAAVVNEEGGTGRQAELETMTVAGKTGTAQVIAQETWTSNDELAPENRDHAWFASFAPAEHPELVVVIMVEHGGGGSTGAAPLAQELYATFFDTDHEHDGPT
ncbi:MAG: penicillin-binding protein 2 [Acidobacteriota bacterium]